MIGLLQQIVDQFVCWIETGVMTVLNLVIVALGAMVTALCAVLPSMPSLPDMPSQFTTAASYIAWFFPVGTLVDVLAFFIAAQLLWWGVSIGLRWAKVIAA